MARTDWSALRRFSPKEAILRRLVTPEIEAQVARMPKPVGSFGYDPWGYNENMVKPMLGVARWLYESYFRVVAHGLEHVPAKGRVLIVANHSGQLPMDGVLLGYALATNPHGPRAPRAMIERFFPTVPWLGNFLNATGAVIGDPLNCTKMLENEETIIVFPEGVRGSGKPYRQRYRLQRFGTGFMHLALAHKTPIVPVGIVGCEETMPALANIAPLAKLLGLPYFPVAPLLPLPARVSLHVGAPMRFKGSAADEAAVGAQVDAVKQAIADLLAQGLAMRTRVW